VQCARGEVAPLSLLAIGHYPPIERQSLDVITELRQRNIYRPDEPAKFGNFVFVAHVQEKIAIGLPGLRRDRRNISSRDVAGYEAGGVHRIIG